MDSEDENIRARLYRMASEHPDADKREAARRMLDVMPKRSAETGSRPENHNAGNGAPNDAVELATDPKPSTASRVAGKVDEYVARPLAQAGNAWTGGALNPVNDFLGTDSPKRRAAQEAEHPYIMGGAAAAGGVAPNGIPGRIGGAISKGVSSGIGAVARYSPRVAAMLGMASRVPGGEVVGRAATSAASGGALGAVLGGAEGSKDGIGGMIEGAEHGGASGAKFGAVLGAGSRLAQTGATALRTPEIALAEKYGMEPGLLKPLVPQDLSKAGGTMEFDAHDGFSPSGAANDVGILPAGFLRQGLKPPPTGVSTANPRTRSDAAIRGAKPIVEDLAAREAVNRGEIGRVRDENDKTFSEHSIHAQDMLLPIMMARQNAGLAPEAAAHLNTLETRVRGASTPPPLGPGIPLLPQSKLRPGDAQQIRMLADDYAGQNKAGKLKSAEGQMRGVSREMQSLQPPEIQAQDRSYSEAQSRIEGSKSALALHRKNPIRTDRPDQTLKAGDTLRQATENTAAGGKAGYRLQSLRENGPPEVMQSSTPAFESSVGRGPSLYQSKAQAPDQVDYGSNMDLPALQSAQESLQLNKSALFSGGAVQGAKRLLGSGSRRTVYPYLKRLGNMETAPQAPVGDAMVSLFRRRAKEKDDERKRQESQSSRQAEILKQD